MKHTAIPSALQLEAIDRSNPEKATTAVHLDWPDTFSDPAMDVVRYLDDTVFLFSYEGMFIVTDEALELTEYGDGCSEAPWGGPRYAGDSLEDVETWLEEVASQFNDSDEPSWIEFLAKQVE